DARRRVLPAELRRARAWSGDDGAVRSFPTRRSSDLGLVGHLVQTRIRRQVQPVPAAEPKHPAAGPGDLRQAARHADLGVPVRSRSEEHTSELQSRENLVCRLLLEKKTYTTQSDEVFV